MTFAHGMEFRSREIASEHYVRFTEWLKGSSGPTARPSIQCPSSNCLATEDVVDF